MVVLYFVAAFAVILPALAGPLLAYRVGPKFAGSRAAARTKLAVQGLIAAFGRPGAAVVVVLAGGYAPDVRDTVDINAATVAAVAARAGALSP